jgi:NRAMP (natural resistance-associated macrophage protein)-like metal ion transporter
MTRQEQKFVKEIAEAPAVILEKTFETEQKIDKELNIGRDVAAAKKYWRALGPGLTTGAADDDPSGIATYSQAGAKYGFSFLWLAPVTIPLMIAVQEMCARIGIVTGRGLAANIKLHFPRWVIYLVALLLFGANSLNIGADLGVMAKSTQLFLPKFNFNLLLVFFTIISLVLQIFMSYKDYSKYLKWLSITLLSYIATALIINLPLGEIIKSTFIPSFAFSKDTIFLLCAFLGTTISPYLFFWQTSQEIEEEILEGQTSVKLRQDEASPREIKKMRIDVTSGMIFSNIITFFIMITCAGTLFKSGIANISTAADAAQALRPLAGDYAYFLFAMGIISTGLLAVPVLAGSAAYAISECFGWKQGLYRKLKNASAFYGVIIFSTLIGFVINLMGLDIIKTLIFSAVINALIAPVILVLIILISGNKTVMGNKANHPAVSLIGWLATLIMLAAGFATLLSQLF